MTRWKATFGSKSRLLVLQISHFRAKKRLSSPTFQSRLVCMEVSDPSLFEMYKRRAASSFLVSEKVWEKDDPVFAACVKKFVTDFDSLQDQDEGCEMCSA